MSRTSWCIILWDMKLVTNILTILQQSKMIYYKCKAFSNRFDLVLGDICWSVSVTDLDDGRISLEGTSRKNQEQPRRSSLFHLSFSICTCFLLSDALMLQESASLMILDVFLELFPGCFQQKVSL